MKRNAAADANKWAHLDSNQGPSPYEGAALTAELWAPATPCSQEKRVTHLHYTKPFPAASIVTGSHGTSQPWRGGRYFLGPPACCRARQAAGETPESSRYTVSRYGAGSATSAEQARPSSPMRNAAAQLDWGWIRSNFPSPRPSPQEAVSKIVLLDVYCGVEEQGEVVE